MLRIRSTLSTFAIGMALVAQPALSAETPSPQRASIAAGAAAGATANEEAVRVGGSAFNTTNIMSIAAIAAIAAVAIQTATDKDKFDDTTPTPVTTGTSTSTSTATGTSTH